MKLPFFNRKRYVVLKCYTDNPFHYEHTPVTLSYKVPKLQSNRPVAPEESSFRACYGSIAGMKRSAVLPMWTDVEFCVEQDGTWRWKVADSSNGTTDVEQMDDPYYHAANGYIVKLTNAWTIQEDTGVNFVYAKHIQNLTPMAIPSGVLSFNHVHWAHCQFFLHNTPHRFRVPFKMPLMALYPMTDLPLHVECYLDKQKREELHFKSQHQGYFSRSMLKLNKNKS